MATPSFYQFGLLPLAEQLGITPMEGTFLATRYNEAGDTINLYHLGDFFAEVYYDPEINRLHNCRTFCSTGPLEAYTDTISLPNL